MRFCILFAVAALLAAANAQTTRGGPVPTAGKTGQAQMVASSTSRDGNSGMSLVSRLYASSI